MSDLASTNVKKALNYWDNKPFVINFSEFHVNSENKNSITDSLSKELDHLKQYIPSDFVIDILNFRDSKKKMEWCDFINTHYQDVAPQMSLLYTDSLMNYMFSHKHITFVLRNKQAIVATISGFFFNNTFFEKNYNTLHCTFLCIHKNFRQKYIAPFLITYFGLYSFKTYKTVNHIFFTTSNPYSDKPFHTSNFFHRPLCIQNLIDTQFLPNTINKEVYQKIYEKKVKQKLPFEFLDKKRLLDVKYSLDTLSNQFNQFYKKNNVNVSYHYTPEFLEKMLQCPDFIFIGHFNESNSKFDNVFVFNKLYYKNGVGTLVKNVILHSYFYKTELKLQELFDSLCFLLKPDFDVITCLDILPESPLKYKFIHGTGKLHYYLYNCNVPKIERNGLSIV
jgi:hypothetical protein